MPDEPTPEQRAAWSHLTEAQVSRLPDDVAVTLLQTGEERRQSLDQMMWQVPVLSLTAQSFLLTIGLSGDARWGGRVAAALLGLVAAFAAVQLLLKHRYHEEQGALWLERFADLRGWPSMHGRRRSEAFAYSGEVHSWKRPDGATQWLRQRLARRRSPYVWVTALALFGAGHVFVLLAGVTELAGGPGLLD